MKTLIKNKITAAFTMIELVFVIVIVGILSVMIAPSFQRNTVQEAADQIVSHIRYTQHLAMMDNKFKSTESQWFQARWHIRFYTDTNGNNVYYIATDKNFDNALVKTEYAQNPLDSTSILSGEIAFDGIGRSKVLDLTDEYGVTATNNCSPLVATRGRIYFDYIGRPLSDTVYPATTPYQNLIQNICTIVVSDGGATNDITIELHPETGYARIKKN